MKKSKVYESLSQLHSFISWPLIMVCRRYRQSGSIIHKVPIPFTVRRGRHKKATGEAMIDGIFEWNRRRKAIQAATRLVKAVS